MHVLNKIVLKELFKAYYIVSTFKVLMHSNYTDHI